jgi:DNA-binding transcriptional LysR family regulator
MKLQRNLPLAALRAFEAAARHGQMTAAAEELAVTHGAVSRHVGHLEVLIGTPLFEGSRNRPTLTAEGRVFGFALTAAFDQMEDALRIIAKSDDTILDVGCLSTFAMRWLIPRLHDFAAQYPRYDVRLATDDRPVRTPVDAQILVVPPDAPTPENASLLFHEKFGMVVAPSMADVAGLPRLETRTRSQIWHDWARLTDQPRQDKAGVILTFDHYHLTIEAALNGLGAAIVPWHLIAEDVTRGRLLAPLGFRDSNYCYVVRVDRPGRRKTEHFVAWLREAVANFPSPPPQP